MKVWFNHIMTLIINYYTHFLNCKFWGDVHLSYRVLFKMICCCSYLLYQFKYAFFGFIVLEF